MEMTSVKLKNHIYIIHETRIRTFHFGFVGERGTQIYRYKVLNDDNVKNIYPRTIFHY